MSELNPFKKPKTPVIPPPAPMPDMDDAAIKSAKRKQAAAIAGRSGRASTIMSDATEKLGS